MLREQGPMIFEPFFIGFWKITLDKNFEFLFLPFLFFGIQFSLINLDNNKSSKEAFIELGYKAAKQTLRFCLHEN